MSDKILLEDDDNAMFGDGDEEEEEEDIDIQPPTVVKPVAAAVKEEDIMADVDETTTEDNPPPPKKKSKWGDATSSTTSPEEVNINGSSSSMDDVVTDATTMLPFTTPITKSSLSSLLLPTSLPPVSPFPHHNAGPTSDRLRNAMSRISANPTRDAEAWQALITEAQSCYRQLLPSLYKLKNMGLNIKSDPNDPEVDLIERKLDWIEACYGALLHYFPYSVTHYVQLVEIYSRLSALTQDEEEQCGAAGNVVMAAMLGTGGGATGAGGGSALSNPVLNTPDQGVAMTPASLLMNPTMVNSSTERQKKYDEKLDKIFQFCLGVQLDGSSALHGDFQKDDSIDVVNTTSLDGARTIMGGVAQHSMDLWLLYIRKRSWDTARSTTLAVDVPPPPTGFTPNLPQQVSVLHQQYEESLRAAYRERKERIRENVVGAYEVALDRGAGFAQNNHLIWKRFVNYVKSWTEPVSYSSAVMSLVNWYPQGVDPHATVPPSDPAHDHSTSQKQLNQLRSIYQRGITHPMTGLDQFWQEYEAFERSHSESLGSVLIAEWLPRYQHARSIYLERNRAWTARDLQMGRLAVPPVGCESGAEGTASGGGAGVGLTSRGGAGAAATLGADDDFGGGDTAGAGGAGGVTATNEAEYLIQMEDEQKILSKWRKRSAFERTNPERLSSSDFAMHVRASYSEEICAFARHPEVWFEWSQWELLHGSSTAASTTDAASAQGNNASAVLTTPAKAGEWRSGGNALRAVAVLSLGIECLPDSALLAQAQAEILDRHLSAASGSAGDKLDESSSDIMGGCIKVLERFVSRSPTTLGFVLLQRLVRRYEGINSARAVFARARRTLRIKEEDISFNDEEKKDTLTAAVETKEDAAGPSDAKENTDGAGKASAVDVSTQQRMVTNRLKETVGATPLVAPTSSEGESDKVVDEENAINAGYITWHLYAAHATIEHRLSKNPKVAARIYELGLRKHRSFLSNPPYVLHYANLLLELNDEDNLRSLLMRAVAACEGEEEEAASMAASGSDAVATASERKRDMQRPLWDMMLKFESVLSSRSNKGNISADISSIEARRRRALYGPTNEDVVMGGEGPHQEEETNSHKNSLNEQLVRVEGYDVASRIANGMGRLVDALTVTGAIGNGEFNGTASSLDFAAAASTSLAAGGTSSDLWGDECAGGPSDVSYIKRLKFQRESKNRAAAVALGLGTAQGGLAGTAGKLQLRERTAGAAGQAAAKALELQNAPEWLRPLLMLLPPVPKRHGTSVKPPPHLTEMALSTLRANPLPESRPESSNGASRLKRGRENDGDSSDEENGKTAGGGYSNQFRARQQARLVSASS